MRRLSPLPALAALVTVVAGPSGCLIFGAGDVPCSNANIVQECDEGQVCLDSVCVALPETPAACVDDERSPTRDVRTTAISAASARGLEAMGDALLGLDAARVVDLSCAPDCGAVTGELVRTRAPLVDDTGASVVLSGTATAGPAQDMSGPFAFELVFRAPTFEGVFPIAASSDGDGTGWLLEAGGGQAQLQVGGTSVVVGVGLEAVWTHLLCVVDPARLDGGDASGVLCSVDGELPLAVEPGPWAPAPGADLALFGDGFTGDPAVAFVRLWEGSFPGLDADPARAQSQILDEGRARLLRYIGVDVESAGRILVSNLNLAPRVVDLPAAGNAARSLALVGGAWPRLATTSVGDGLFFEPTSQSFLQGLEDCPFLDTGPTEKTDACFIFDNLFLPTSVPRNETFTFSAYFPKGTASLGVAFEEAPGLGSGSLLCDLTLDDGACGNIDATLEDLGDWRRFSVTLALGFDVARVVVSSVDGASIWSPQLELGDVATSPIPFFFSPLGFYTTGRVFDAVFLSEVDLGNTSELTLEANVLRATGEVFPIIVADDEELDDNAIQLAASFGAGQAQASVAGRVEQTALEGARAIGSPPVVVAAHVGAEVADCGASCQPVGPVRAGRMQAEIVVFLGPSAVVERAAVHSRGAAPRPTPLVVRVGAPARVPCLAGTEPTFVFSVCPAPPGRGEVCGLGDVTSPWDGAANAVDAITAGAFPGELATRGAFAADLIGRDALGALVLEARFQTPSEGGGGEVVAILDEGDEDLVTLRLQANDDNTYTVFVGTRGTERGLTTLGPAEWNQVTCLFDDAVRCIVNLDEPVTFTDFAPLDRPRLISASVSSPGKDGLVAGARAWFVDSPANQDDAVALLSGRALESFGFLVDARRAAVVAEELRGSPSFVSIQGPGAPSNSALALRRVGTHWPRVEDIRGTIEYAADAGGVDALRDDDVDDGSEGPHPSIRAQRITGDTELQLDPAARQGIVSIFVSGLDGGETAELASPLATVSLPGAGIEGDAGVDDYGEWQRLWVKAGVQQGATLRISGTVLVAAPQREELAVVPGPPAIRDTLAGDTLLLRTADLSSAAATSVELSVEPTSAVGRFFSLKGSSFDGGETVNEEMSLSADGDNLVVLVEVRRGIALEPASTEDGVLPAVGPLGSFAYWSRGSSVVLRREDGGLVFGSAPALGEPAEELRVGSAEGGRVAADAGGRIRLRSVAVRRGDY